MLVSFGKGEPMASRLDDKFQEIVVIDDEYQDLGLSEDCCGEEFKVLGLSSVAQLFRHLSVGHKPQIIFLDIDMPEVDGLEALRMFKTNPLTNDIPVVVVTAKHDQSSALRGIQSGAVDYVPKPFLPHLIRNRVQLHLKLKGCQKTIKEQAARLKAQNFKLENYRSFLLETVNSRTGKMADLQTAILQTVSDLATFSRGNEPVSLRHWELRILLEALRDRGLGVEEAGFPVDWDIIVQSSNLHDVGKLAIEESIINKPGKLTFEEFETVKKHTTLGVDILDKVAPSTNIHQFLRLAKVFAGTHHEKWDGSGYPIGLRGENIPFAGRLMALADVYDGLTGYRPWKSPHSHDEAVRVIVEGRGSHFDPVMVDVFSAVADSFKIAPPGVRGRTPGPEAAGPASGAVV
jgi:putative two-component system response regulator